MYFTCTSWKQKQTSMTVSLQFGPAKWIGMTFEYHPPRRKAQGWFFKILKHVFNIILTDRVPHEYFISSGSKVVAHRFPSSSSPGFVIYSEGCETDFHPRSKERERNGSILSKYKAHSRGRGRSIGFKGEREREREWRAGEREKTGEKFWDRKRGRAVRLERLRGMKTLGFWICFWNSVPLRIEFVHVDDVVVQVATF